MSSRVGIDLDTLARDLASGAISRRTALRRFGGVALGAMLPGALFASDAFARCPKERRCDGRCCPKHAHCHHGKCRCNRGFTKCSGHCRNLETDERNCGRCGHRCADGETCRNGHCHAAQTQQVCGNDVREGTEVCDGSDLGGATCESLDMGFTGGTLACAPDCMAYDTSGCTSPQCSSATDCGTSTECVTFTCDGGVCGAAFTAAGTPVSSQVQGDCQKNVCDGSGHMVTQPDPTDPASDGNECTVDTCDGTTTVHSDATYGTPCNGGGPFGCDGQGNCVQFCESAGDCPQGDNPCKSPACAVGICGFTDKGPGTSCTTTCGGTKRGGTPCSGICDGFGTCVPT